MPGHDGHFLSRLDRVAHDQVSFALSLYRDHEAVRFLLDRVDLDARTARVALAIGDEQKGPFVVVARDGHFVTCLGEGMSVGRLPVVERARIDALLAKHRDQKHRDSVRDLEQHEGESDVEFFRRLMQSGDDLTREQFVAYSAVQALIAPTFIKLALEDQVWMLQQLPRLRGFSRLRSSHATRARVFETKRWFIGHALLLGTMGAGDELDTFRERFGRLNIRFNNFATGLCSTTIALRAAWAASRIGACLLPPYADDAQTASTGVDILDIAMTVAAIGLFDSHARRECTRILDKLREPLGEDAEIDEVRHDQSQHARLLLDDDALAAKLAIARGQQFFIDITRHLPASHPIRYEAAADVPDDLAKTTLLECDLDPFTVGGQATLFLALSLLRDARAEDFYFTRDVCSRVVFETEDEEILGYIRRFDHVYDTHRESARSEKVGRNDPCPCGSGKKYKRCCGGK